MSTARWPAPAGCRTATAPPAPRALPRRVPLSVHHREPVLDVVVPVHNEENDLEPCVRRLHAHLAETFPYPFRITVADNASTDRTPRIAERLARELPGTEWLRLAEKGRGRALHTAWSRSRAPVLAYLDVDLSTDLAALLPLVAPLISGHSDIAIGTRLAPGSRVVARPQHAHPGGEGAGGRHPAGAPSEGRGRPGAGAPVPGAGGHRRGDRHGDLRLSRVRRCACSAGRVRRSPGRRAPHPPPAARPRSGRRPAAAGSPRPPSRSRWSASPTPGSGGCRR